MLTRQTKWWRWIGEESLSGGKIGTYEGGGTYPCGQKRPSSHSMMRWIGFDFDQIGLEHMVARVTGMRNSGQMNVQNTAVGTVAKDSGPVGRARQPALPRASPSRGAAAARPVRSSAPAATWTWSR